MGQNIIQILAEANIHDYAGTYTELGGGELNDTFLISCKNRKLILRIARYADQKSLQEEANALSRLGIMGVPTLVFFDKHKTVDGKSWILESYITGHHVERLSVTMFNRLGELLAKVHESTKSQQPVDLWGIFLERRKKYVSESIMAAHPDKRLRRLYPLVRDSILQLQQASSASNVSIIHADATPTNILVEKDSVGLIDWEFSHVNDPMAEFSTIYYEDIDYNHGKWRVQITPEEKAALFNGYHEAGGVIDEHRINLWMNVDKLGAALYLYWRMNLSGRPTTTEQTNLYSSELEKLIKSLENSYGIERETGLEPKFTGAK